MRKAMAVVLLLAGGPPICAGMSSILLGAALLPGERDGGRAAVAVGIMGVLIGLGLGLTIFTALRHAQSQAKR